MRSGAADLKFEVSNTRREDLRFLKSFFLSFYLRFEVIEFRTRDFSFITFSSSEKFAFKVDYFSSVFECCPFFPAKGYHYLPCIVESCGNSLNINDKK